MCTFLLVFAEYFAEFCGSVGARLVFLMMIWSGLLGLFHGKVPVGNLEDEEQPWEARQSLLGMYSGKDRM